MTAEELRRAIIEALAELLTPQPRRALVLFTGGLLGFEDAIASLGRLRDAGVELDYLQTPSSKKILDQDQIASLGMQEVSNKLVAEHQLLIAPTLTANIAAKVSHGVADCLASNLFSEFIMANKLVVASRTAICPDGAAKREWFPQIPPGYADLLRSNLTTLASFGVRLTEARTLARTSLAAFERAEQARRAPVTAALGISLPGLLALSSTGAGTATAGPAPVESTPSPAGVTLSDALVSQQVIQQLPHGASVRISARAMVTAMARDLAASRSIRITREV